MDVYARHSGCDRNRSDCRARQDAALLLHDRGASTDEVVAYLGRLAGSGYLERSLLAKIDYPGRFQLTNCASADPKETAFLISKPFPVTGDAPGFAMMTIGGSGGVYHRRSDSETVSLPPREPRILPAE